MQIKHLQQLDCLNHMEDLCRQGDTLFLEDLLRIAKDNELRDYPALRKELAQLQRDQAVDYLDKG